jgi:hypothetical protein
VRLIAKSSQPPTNNMDPKSKWSFRKSYRDAGRRVKGILNPPSPQASSGANSPSHPQSTQSLPVAAEVVPPLDPAPTDLRTISAISQDPTNTSHKPTIQPLPSADLTSPPRATVPTSSSLPLATTTAIQSINKPRSSAWAGLGNALGALKECSDVFPPLKSAVSGLLGCLDVLQVSTWDPVS